MNCDSVSKLIPLYFYGEVTPDEEDRVDQHLHECAACAAQMEQQRALAMALDQRLEETPPALLDECREDLMAAIAGGAPRLAPAAKGAWTLLLEAMTVSLNGFKPGGFRQGGFGRMRQPVGAVLLLLVGFLAARFTGAGGTVSGLPSNNAGVLADSVPTVRDVKADNDGTVRIRFDETSHHEMTGTLQDPNIRRLILAGSHDEDAAVRVESVGLLKGRVDSPEVLDSLLNAMSGDPNDGVRLRALDALKPMAGDPRVSRALSQVLLTDVNPSMRIQVIDLVAMRRDDSVVGVLQNLMQREDNNGVRVKASKVLKDWNASIGTF